MKDDLGCYCSHNCVCRYAKKKNPTPLNAAQREKQEKAYQAEALRQRKRRQAQRAALWAIATAMLHQPLRPWGRSQIVKLRCTKKGKAAITLQGETKERILDPLNLQQLLLGRGR